ncbi:MAG: tetratricopeptide repeat protein [Thermoplasmataceae archaeon]
MEKALSFSNAVAYFKRVESEIAEKPSMTYIIMGEDGTGKGPLIKLLMKDFEEKGLKYYSTKIFTEFETIRFYPFNDILNQISQESKVRDLNTIVDELTRVLSGPDHLIIIFENLHKMSQQSLDMFLYFSKLGGKLGFTFIGVTETSGSSSNAEKFIEEAKLLPNIFMISLKKPEMEDVKCMLKEEGYKLEEAFVKDLVRLVNGDLNILSYTLAYYKDEGFIDPDGSLNSIKVRFFPIPPSLESHYNNTVTELDKNSQGILKVLAMIKVRLAVNDLSYLLNTDESTILESLSLLESRDLIKNDQGTFSIKNSFLYAMLDSYITASDKIKFSTRLNSSELVNKLSIPSRILMNLSYGNAEEAVRIFAENSDSINSSINDPQEAYDAILKIKPYLKDEGHILKARFSEGNALYLLSHYKEAAEILNDEKFKEAGMVAPFILLTSIYNGRGDYKKSEEIINSLFSGINLKKEDEAKLLIANSTIEIRKNDYKKADELVDKAIAIATEGNFEDTVAEAYNIKGIIKINTFKIEEAGTYFKKALEINTRKKNWFSSLKNMNNLAITNGMMGDYQNSLKNFKEIVDISYITSDLRGRAYAEFNLVEQLDIIGETSESENYIPTAEKLVSLVSDASLECSFHRFYGLHLLQYLKFRQAKDQFEISGKKAVEANDIQRVRINKFFELLMEEIISSKRIKETDENISIKFELEEDFIPTVYIFITIRYLLYHEYDKALESALEASKSAIQINDNGYKAHSSVFPSLVYLAKGDLDNFSSELSKISEPDRTIKYPNLVYWGMKALQMGDRAKLNEVGSAIEALGDKKIPPMNKLLLNAFISFIEEKFDNRNPSEEAGMQKHKKMILDGIASALRN